MFRILIIVMGGMFFNNIMAQDLYQPREVKNAYKNGTRSPDGKPGANYWQNHGRYDITITTAPRQEQLKDQKGSLISITAPTQ